MVGGPKGEPGTDQADVVYDDAAAMKCLVQREQRHERGE